MNLNFHKTVFTIVLLTSFLTFSQNKILFNATKAEMCSNADWVIDADLNNIFFSGSTHLPYANSNTGGESNPQRFPTPIQSGISSSTDESYWNGAISAWAVDCVKQGYVVESLPFNAAITYGSTTNAQDLSNYKLFVVDEPNILFSAAEKTAILNFIYNGGSLYMISDHAGSDRNFDGYDSPMIWNDLMTNNSVQTNPFGITFNLVASPNGISQTTTKVANLPSDPILHGAFGAVTKLKYSGGDSMTLNTFDNASVQGIIFENSSANSGLTNVFCAYANFGNGKIAALGDSSPTDDNTGDANDTLYNGYYDTSMAGNHQRLIMNTTIWLMSSSLSNNENIYDNTYFTILQNPVKEKQIHLSFSNTDAKCATITIYDYLGRLVKETCANKLNFGINYQNIEASDLQSGNYICKLSTSTDTKTLHFILN